MDAGLYSKELMSHCEELARQSEEKAKPQDILTVAHSRTTSQGSATAIVAVLRGKVHDIFCTSLTLGRVVAMLASLEMTLRLTF